MPLGSVVPWRIMEHLKAQQLKPKQGTSSLNADKKDKEKVNKEKAILLLQSGFFS